MSSLIPSPTSTVGTSSRATVTGATSSAVLRERLDARQRAIQSHLADIRHETSTVFSDVTLGGRPVADRIRQRPTAALVLSVSAGALVGVLLGKRARTKRLRAPSSPADLLRARLAMALDEAAHRVAKGGDVEDSLRRAMKHVPVPMDEPPAKTEKTPRQEAFGVALNTIVGFGTKMLLDQVAQKMTGEPGIVSAVAEAEG